MRDFMGYANRHNYRLFSLFVVMMCAIFSVSRAEAQSSDNPRQKGEIRLIEILTGPQKFIIRTDSNGCTSRNSFKVDIKKEKSSSKTPLYSLVIIRIAPDECKAIVDEGAMVAFDLKKDLGLKGDFAYSVANKVVSSDRVQQESESMISVIEKKYSLDASAEKQPRD